MLRSDVHERIATGTQQAITLLGLTQSDGTTPANVFKLTIPTDKVAIRYPCILVTFEDGAEEEGEHCFESQYVMFPIQVLLADRQPAEDQRWRPFVLSWRKQVLDVLRNAITLPGCPEVYDVRVRPMRAIPADLLSTPGYEHVLSGLTVQAYTSEDVVHVQ